MEYKALAIIRFVVLFGLVIAGPAKSYASELSGPAIRQLVSGKTVVLSTPYGLQLPLRYDADGSVFGDGTAAGLGKYFAPRERGKWWIDDRQLCQRWQSWYGGKTYCFSVRKVGERLIRWVRDDGYSGMAEIRQ